jgi:ribosome-binding factor A
MSQRMEKVQKLARQVLGEEMQNLKDPRVGFATITAVKITPDLRHARVWVSVLGTDDEVKDTMAGLNSARPYLRTELGRQMRMKYLPELIFELDTGAEEAQRLDEILHKIHVRDSGASAGLTTDDDGDR